MGNGENIFSGFELYELLRYIFPGVLLVFLFGYAPFPEYLKEFSFLKFFIDFFKFIK